jgi:MEDS: MEthanogen/methylotroph, DcmR Sensory domain
MCSVGRRAPAVGVDRLQPGDHAFLAFSDDEQRWEILRTFTQQGFARDEQVILLVDTAHSPDEVAARVAGGVTARLALDSGRLVVSTTPRFGPGGFNAKKLVDKACAGMDAAVRAGYSGVRAGSEMSLKLAPVDRLEQAVEYETLLQETMFAGQASRRCTAMCMWDERRFHGEPAMDAVRAIHPVTILERVGMLLVMLTATGVRLTGDSDLSTRAEFTGALRALASQPGPALVLDIADLSFLDVYSAGRVLGLAADLVPPRRLEVRCRNVHRRMLHALGARSVPQLSIVTERL